MRYIELDFCRISWTFCFSSKIQSEYIKLCFEQSSEEEEKAKKKEINI